MQKTIHPIVKWAQRKDRVFLIVEVQDLKEEKVDLKADSIEFSAVGGGVKYQFSLNFFAEINVEESKQHNYTLNYRFILVKKDKSAPYWTRLTKENNKTQWIQIDWQKYIDEDDEEEEGHKGLDGWDSDQFQNMQGGQGMDDEDDEPEGDAEGEGDGDKNDLDKDEPLPDGKQEKAADGTNEKAPEQ